MYGLLDPTQQQQQQPNNGPLLGGQPMTMPQNAAAQPGIMQPQMGQQGGGSPGFMPNLNAGNAGAMASGLNLAAQSMPHPAGQPMQGTGLTAQGMIQAMHSGMGAGMNMAGHGPGMSPMQGAVQPMANTSPTGGTPQQMPQMQPQGAPLMGATGMPANGATPQPMPAGANWMPNRLLANTGNTGAMIL